MADAKIELLLCEAAATMASDVSEANVAIETSSWNSELDDTVDVPQNAGASRSEAADAAPIASKLPIPSLPSLHIKRVRFNLEDTSIEFITPYAEIYGAHPRTFVFDKDSLMIPAARGGFVSADYVMGAEEDLDDDDDDDCETSQEDGGWESWLLEQESSDDYAELDRTTSLGLSHDTCLPDLDDPTGWERWLESICGNSQEQLFSDTIQCHEEQVA